MTSTRSTTHYYMTGACLSAALICYLIIVHPKALQDSQDVQVYKAVRAAQHNPVAQLSGLQITVGNITYPVRPDGWPLPQTAAGTFYTQAMF